MNSRAALLPPAALFAHRQPRAQALLRTVFFLATAVLSGAIAGCGASSNPPPTNGTAPTNLVYPQTTITATAGQAITADTPTVTGTVTTYSVNPGLPGGLTLNTTTGAITGTPTAAVAQASYTVTATNSAGSTTAALQIVVNAAVVAPTNLVYPQTTITATAGQAITADTPTVTGTVTTYSVNPGLPGGLTLNTTTGAITGTPTAAVAQASYTVTATNSAGSTTAALQIVVNAAVVAPTNLVYPQTTITATAGQAITADTPTVTGTVTTYSVNPGLPGGLTLNTTTGAITGTPTAAVAQASYTVTATNSAGNTTAALQIVVNAAVVAPTNLVYPETSIVTSAGQTVANDMPTISGSPALFSTSPALPCCLGINSVNGSIGGVGVTPSPQTTYTITAANSAGSVTTPIAVTVNKALPILLNVGHDSNITALRVSAMRVLSQDFHNHWALWDNTTTPATEIIGGYQVIPTYIPAQNTPTSWPIDMAGSLFVVGQANGVDVRAVSDGHLVYELQSPQIDSAQGKTWWKLATDGSYLCFGSQQELAIWSSSGQQLFIEQGDYSAAKAFATPSQLLIALGAAGPAVIETISIASATSSVGQPFAGTFNSWFTDGSSFFTNTANTVWIYSSTGTLQPSSPLSLPTVENLTGYGTWFWTHSSTIPTYPFAIYQIGNTTPTATYDLSADTALIPSANTIGIISNGVPSISIVDLSGASPVKSDYPLPMAYQSAYAAVSASQWIVGNRYGVVLDGTTAATTPRYFGTGQAWSIAGGTNYVAIATASGKIYYYSTSSNSTTPVGTISFPSSQIELSSDGTVLEGEADTLDAQYETDRTLNVYSLPSGNLSFSTPYQFVNDIPGATPAPDLLGFTLSGSGTVTGQELGTYNSTPSQWTFTRQASPTTGGAIIWSDTPTSPPASAPIDETVGVMLSPDGTLIAVSSGPYSTDGEGKAYTPSSTTNIYKNGLFVATVPGFPIAWIDNNQILVNNYTASGPSSLYSNASIYSATGSLLSTPILPELYQIQPLSSTSIYVPSLNQILALPSGAVTYSSTTPLTGPAAIAGTEIVFASGTLIVADTY